MPALSIPIGDYDVYWACFTPEETPQRVWGSDPAYAGTIDELADPIQITIQPESDRETGTIGGGPAFGDILGSLGSSSLSFGS